jgi:protein FAM98B
MTAKCITEMLTALQFSKPPEDITPEALFKKLSTKIAEIIKQVPAELLRKPLCFGELSNDQWEKLNNVQADFNEEYKIRREMLLQRLDVTINSFSVQIMI